MAVNQKPRPEALVVAGGMVVFAMGLLFAVLSILRHVPSAIIEEVFTTGASLMILGILVAFLRVMIRYRPQDSR